MAFAFSTNPKALDNDPSLTSLISHLFRRHSNGYLGGLYGVAIEKSLVPCRHLTANAFLLGSNKLHKNSESIRKAAEDRI